MRSRTRLFVAGSKNRASPPAFRIVATLRRYASSTSCVRWCRKALPMTRSNSRGAKGISCEVSGHRDDVSHLQRRCGLADDARALGRDVVRDDLRAERSHHQGIEAVAAPDLQHAFSRESSREAVVVDAVPAGVGPHRVVQPPIQAADLRHERTGVHLPVGGVVVLRVSLLVARVLGSIHTACFTTERAGGPARAAQSACARAASRSGNDSRKRT